MAEVERANSYAGNSLLRNLAPQDLAKLTLHLEPCEVPVHFIFNQPRKEIRDCYFLTRGMASTVAVMQDGSCAVIGVTGSEGLVGFQSLLGVPSLAHQTIMQVSGAGFRVETAMLRELTGELPGLRHAIDRFIWASLAFYGQCAACNRLHTLEQRLCRWLLIVRDRIHGNTLPLTHELLGNMLGAHRSSVTLVVGALERSGLIEKRRGRIHLLNLQNLENVACECYKVLRSLATAPQLASGANGAAIAVESLGAIV